jgi:hypothetical protein
MQVSTGGFADSGNTLAQAGTVIQQAAEMKRSKSPVGRAVSAVTALTVGARFVPGARRLVRRNPLIGTLLIAGTVVALVLIYSKRARR